MSRHLNSIKNEISQFVLMAGNPERVKWAAEKFLKNYKLVNYNRGAFIYSGFYNGLFVSFATSGMGMPSMAIYATELYTNYNVEIIIRIGTAGSYSEDLNLFDIVNSKKTFTDSNIGKNLGYKNNFIEPDLNIFNLINKTAIEMNINIKNNISHTTDLFYQNFEIMKKIADKNKLSLCEMETYILWVIAKQLNKKAATILLVSDIIFHKKNKKTDSTFKERIIKTKECWKLALETLIKLK